ncbi:hypothetical protein AK88_01996 [Plasmodium fragile]|uniref:Uncharacterized protein n=1 Tax=Plasmodium fragile TaxID=5857 RepID=A0A0D9QMR2_PLAFR|nr:uncharacterized protein AK88_01996 [Plasmodium fragile]KJP88380.1 hypothetical protein AK88_01996 [Plasmodium fragile]
MENSMKDFLNAKGNITQNGVPSMELSRSPNNAAPSITQEQFNIIMCSIKRKDKNDQAQTSPQMETQHNVENFYPLDNEYGMCNNHKEMNYLENQIVTCTDTPEKTYVPIYLQTDLKGTQLHAAQNNVMHHLQELLPPTPLHMDIKMKQLSKKSDHCYCSVGDDVGVHSISDQGHHLIMHGRNKAQFISLLEDVQEIKNPQMDDVQSCVGHSSTNYSAAQLEDLHKTLTRSHCSNQMDRGPKEEVRCGGVNGDLIPSLRSFIADGAPKIDHVISHRKGEISMGSSVEHTCCTDAHAEESKTNSIGRNPPSRLLNHPRNKANDYDTSHRELNLLHEIKQEVLNEGTMPADELSSNIHLAPPQGHYKNKDLLLDMQNVCNLNDRTAMYRCDSRVSNQPSNEERHMDHNYKNVFTGQEENIFGRYSNCNLVRNENVLIYGDGVEGGGEMGPTHQRNLPNEVMKANHLSLRENNLPPLQNKLRTSKESYDPGGEDMPSQKITNCAINQSFNKMLHFNNPGKQINVQNSINLLDDYIRKTKINKMLLSSMESFSPATIQDELNQGYVNPNWNEQPFSHDMNEVNKSNHINRVDMEEVPRHVHTNECPLVDKGTNVPHDILVSFANDMYRDLHNRINDSEGEKCIGRLNVNTVGMGNCAGHIVHGGQTYGNKFEFYGNPNGATKGNSLTEGSCAVTADTNFKPYCKEEDHLLTNIDLRNEKQNNSIVSTVDDKSKWLVSLYRRMNNINLGNSLMLKEHVMSTSRLINPHDNTDLISGGISCIHSEEGGGMLLDECNRIGTFSPEGYFIDTTQKRRGISNIVREGNNYVPSNPANFLLNYANKGKEGIAPLSSLMLHQNKQHSICHSVQLNRAEEHHTRCTSNAPPHHHNHRGGNEDLDILTNNPFSYEIGRMEKKALPLNAPMCNTDDSNEVKLLNPIKKIIHPLRQFQFDHHGGACNATIWGDLVGLARGEVDVALDLPIGNITGGGADTSNGRNDNHDHDCYVEGYTSGYPQRYPDIRSTTMGDIPPGSKLGIIIQNIRYYSNKVFNDVFMNNDSLKKKKLTELNLYLAKLRLKNYQDFFFNLNKFYEMFLLLLNSNYVHKFNSSILYSICVVAKNLLVLRHLGVYILHVIKTCLYCVVKLILIKPISISDKAWFFLLNLYKSLFEKLYQYFKSDLLIGECEKDQRDLNSYDENALAILLPFIHAFNETILEYAKIRIISRNKKKEELIAFPLYESLKPFFFVNTNYPDEADGLGDRTAADITEVEDVPLEEAQEGPGYTARSRQVGDGKAQATNAACTECQENTADTGNTGNLEEAKRTTNQAPSETTDETTEEASDDANERTASLKKTSFRAAPFVKRKNSEDIPVQKHTYGYAKNATQLGPINRMRDVDSLSSEQQSGKVDSQVKFYSKKKAEEEELAVSIRNNILCCVHALIKMFSHIYINNWDKILYYYNENRKKWIPIFLTLTMNDQNQKIRTNSILCLKYLFDCKQLKYWFLLKEGNYGNVPLGSHVSGHMSGHVTFPQSYSTGRTSSHEATSHTECPYQQTNNLTKEISNENPTKKIIQLNRQNQNVQVKGDDKYLPPRNNTVAKNSYSRGYTSLSSPDKQTKQNIYMGKEHHPIHFFSDMNNSLKREAEIGTNGRSPLGSFQRDNQMQTYGQVKNDNPVGRNSNCGILTPKQDHRYESYAKEESNDKGNYSSAKKAATEQNIVKLLTKFTKLITRTYVVDRENNFYTPTDRLNICRFFLRVSQSILIPKYKNLLRKILKFFFFYLLKYLIYFNHGDAFHFCIKKLLQKDGTSKRNRQPEKKIPYGYSLLPYISQFAERERDESHFSSANVVFRHTNSNVYLSSHRSEMLRMKQMSDNDFYPHDYLDEDERVFSSLSNYLNNFRDTEEHEESDVQGVEQPLDQRNERSGGAFPKGVEGDDPNSTGKDLPIQQHRMIHLSLADQDKSATEGEVDKKTKQKNKADMKKGKKEKEHTDSNNEEGEVATPNHSNKYIMRNDKSTQSIFEEMHQLPPSRVHSNGMDQMVAHEKSLNDRTDMAPRTDALQLKNPTKRKKKKKRKEERKDDEEHVEADSQEEESTRRSICSCKHTNIIDTTKNIKKVRKKRSDNDLSYLYKHIDQINKKLLSREDYDLLISILYCNEYSRGSKYITMITVIINIFSVLLCNYNDEIFRFLCTNIYGVNINGTLNDHNIYCYHASHNQLYDISFAQLIYFMLIFLYKIFYQPCADGIDIWMESGNELLGEKRSGEATVRRKTNPGDKPQECQQGCHQQCQEEREEEEKINLDNNTEQDYPLRGHPNRVDPSNTNLRTYRYEKKYMNNSYKDLYDNYIISYMQQERNDVNHLNNLLNKGNVVPNLIPYDIQIFKNILLVFQKTLKHYLFCYMHCWNDVKTLLEYFLQSENVHIKIISIKIVIDIFCFINSYYEVNSTEYELPIYKKKDEYSHDNIFNSTASNGRKWDNCVGEHTLCAQLGGRKEELPPCDEVFTKNNSDTGVFKTGFTHGVYRSPYGSVHSRSESGGGARRVSPHRSYSREGYTSMGNNSTRDTSNRLANPPRGTPHGSASKHEQDHMQNRASPEPSTNGIQEHPHSEASQMSKKNQFVQLVERDMIDLFRKYILVHIHNINKIHNDITNRRSKLKHIFLNTIICISHLSYTGFKILTVEDIQRLTKLVSSCVHSIKCNIITALSKYIIKYIFTFNKKFIQNYEKRINLLHINSTNVYYNNILTATAGVSRGGFPGGAAATDQGGISYASKNDMQQNDMQKNIKSNAYSETNIPSAPLPSNLDTFEQKCKKKICTSITKQGVTCPQINGTSTNMFIHATPTNMSSEQVNGRCKGCPVLVEEEAKGTNDEYPSNASVHDESYTRHGWHDKKDVLDNDASAPNQSNSRRSSNSKTDRMKRQLRHVGSHSACTMGMEKSTDPIQYEHSSDVTPYSSDTNMSAKIGVLNDISEKERKLQSQKQQEKKWTEDPVRCISIADSTFKCSRGQPMMEEQTCKIINPGGSNADQMANKNPSKHTYTKGEEDDKDKDRFSSTSLSKMATNTRNVNKDKMSKLCALMKRKNRMQNSKWEELKKCENLQSEMSSQVSETNTHRNNKQVLLPSNGEIAKLKKNTEHVTAQSRRREKYLISSLNAYENDQGDEPLSKDSSMESQRKDAYLLQKQRSERKLFELYYIYIYIIIHIIKFYNDSFVDLKYYTYNCICEIASSYVPFYFTQNNIKTFSYYSNYNSEENKDINKFINFINGIQLSADVDELKLFHVRQESSTSRGDTVTDELLECNHRTHQSAEEGFFHKGVTCATCSSNNTTASSTCAKGRGAASKVSPCRGVSNDTERSIPTLGNHSTDITAHKAENLHDQFQNNIYLISYIEYIYILLLIIRENKNVEKDRAICCIIRYVGFICKNINFFLFNSISLLPSTFLLKYFMYLNNVVQKKGLLGGGLCRVGSKRSKVSSHDSDKDGARANEEDVSKGENVSLWREELHTKMKTNLNNRNRSASSNSSSDDRPSPCAHQGETPHGQPSSEVTTCDEQKSKLKMTSTHKCKLYHLFLNVYVKYEYNFEDRFFSSRGGAEKLEVSDEEKGIPIRTASWNEDPPQRSEPNEGGRRKKKKKENTCQGEKPGRGQNTSVHDAGHAPQEPLTPEHLFQGYSEKREEKVHTNPIVIQIKDIFHCNRGKSNPINKASNNVDAKIILYLLSIVKDHIKNKITWNVLYAFKLIYNNFSFFLTHNFAELHSQILDHLISTLRYTNVYKIKILSSLALIHIPLYYNINKIKLKELWDTLVTNISYLDLIFVSDKSNTNQLVCYYDKGLNYLTISKKTEYKYKCTLRVNICELLYMCIYRSYVHANINADIEFHNRRVNCYEAFKNYTHIFNINNDVHIYNLTHIFNNHVTYYSFYNNVVVTPKKLSNSTFSGGGGVPTNGRTSCDRGHSMEVRTTSVVKLRQDRSHVVGKTNQVGGTLKKEEVEECTHHDIFELQLFLNNHFDKYHFVYTNLLGTGKNPIFQILFQKLHYEIKLSLKRFLEKRKLNSLEHPRGVSS